MGLLRLEDGPGGARLNAASPFGSPAYDAGIDRDDVIVSIGGTTVATTGDIDKALASRKPGDRLPVTFSRRGQLVQSALVLVEDPRREIVTAEDAAQPVSDAQRRFRDSWLKSAARNVF